MVELLGSGSEVVNKLLEGGYEKEVVTSIYGPAGSGKTTMCLMAAIDCIKNQGKKVIFVDTEGGFSVVRLNQLCDDEGIFEKVFLLKPTTFEEQTKTIRKLKDLVDEKIGLIIVDTISMLYRIEFGKNEGNIKQINSELGLQISFLTEIARKQDIPVILTNQVYSDFDEKGSVKMVGGDILNYGSKCLVELQKFKNKRKAIIKKARALPENKEVIFSIKENGFEEFTQP